MTHRHPFVAVEGLDGAGKSTLRKGLFRLWEDVYGVTPLCVLTTNHLRPGLVPALIDGKFRPSPANRAPYLAALAEDKRTALERLVRPHRGHRPVLADRWLLSELAFFAVKHAMDVPDTYRALTSGLHEGPDVTLVLDLGTAESLRRAQGRPGDPTRADWDTSDVQRRVREVYAQVTAAPAAAPLLGEVVRLDAAAARPDVLHAAWTALDDRGLLPPLPAGPHRPLRRPDTAAADGPAA